MAFSPSAGACELSQKLLNERWTPYLQLRPAVVMLRGGIRLLGRALVYFLHRESEGNGATGKHFPERKASPWRWQAGGLSDCLSLGGPHLIKDVGGAQCAQ